MISDIYLLAIPVTVVWNLQLPTKKKAGCNRHLRDRYFVSIFGSNFKTVDELTGSSSATICSVLNLYYRLVEGLQGDASWNLIPVYITSRRKFPDLTTTIRLACWVMRQEYRNWCGDNVQLHAVFGSLVPASQLFNRFFSSRLSGTNHVQALWEPLGIRGTATWWECFRKWETLRDWNSGRSRTEWKVYELWCLPATAMAPSSQRHRTKSGSTNNHRNGLMRWRLLQFECQYLSR